MKILVIVDERQFWITKDRDRCLISEMLVGDIVTKRMD